MKYNKNFDVDEVFRILSTVNDKYEEGSPEDEALRIAAVALFYVREIKKLEDYREFFWKFYTPARESIKVAQRFATREEADAWLQGGAAVDGDLVSIAGQGFLVIDHGAKGLKFVRIPLPEELPP